MKTIECVSPNELYASRQVIGKFTADRSALQGESDCGMGYATPEDFPKDKFWIFDLIEGFQFNKKIAGKTQKWSIDTNYANETMLFRCYIDGKVVASRIVEWVTFPQKTLTLYVINGVVRLTADKKYK